MAAILCEQVGPGMRPSERCVSVRDVLGRREWILVEQDYLAVRQDRTYLPVGVVQVDRERQLVLVEFPPPGGDERQPRLGSGRRPDRGQRSAAVILSDREIRAAQGKRKGRERG